MAKQSGIHQLRGKVGEHSYYRQTGIDSGLVRSINQGMSSRVKTDEAFLNTRLNNAEFGQAGRIAAVVARYITPKFRPMVLPFSQSVMAKIILEFIKTDSTAPWGERNIVASNSGDMQVAALNAVAKTSFGDYGLDLTVDEENLNLTVEFTDQTVSKLSAIGADGLTVRFVASTTWIGIYDQSTRKYAQSFARANVYEESVNDPSAGDNFGFDYELRPAPPQGWPAFMATRTGILIVLPFREINGTRHILQEYCTFKAFVIADGAVN